MENNSLFKTRQSRIAKNLAEINKKDIPEDVFLRCGCEEVPRMALR